MKVGKRSDVIFRGDFVIFSTRLLAAALYYTMNDVLSDAPEITNTACANCGKGEENSGDLKACTACKLVKYCNRECQIAHRPLHKKACKKRAAELHDEALFKEHPPNEDCPICFLPMERGYKKTAFHACCGKTICDGCIYAMDEEARGRGKIDLCAFCREPNPSSDEELIEQLKRLVEAGNADAFNALAGAYARGNLGMQQNWSKANELFLRAGELGCAVAYYNLGNSYDDGRGVEVDKKKAKHYLELAAMNGSVEGRYNLGCGETEAGNIDRAKKHFILSARAGFKKSLDQVKKGYLKGIITKDEYANTLRAYQQRHDEMKSDSRDKKRAAELHDEALFKEHPPREDCPICFLPLPANQTTFKSCCGKIICNGCILAMFEEADERGGELGICAFCRKPSPTTEEELVERIQKLMDANNADAFRYLAEYYEHGKMGLPQDITKANEFRLRAGELGCAAAYCNLGVAYDNGDGVEMDKKKAKYYYELAAINGSVEARHNLGCLEGNSGNINRAKKHYILAARAGHKQSLDMVKEGFMRGIVTKDEYENTLRAYQQQRDEMKSDDRDKAGIIRGRDYL